MKELMNNCPCKRDCPDRAGGCTLTCTHGYPEWRKARDEEYARRKQAAEENRIASAGRRKAAIRCAKFAQRHGHGRRH